jgi:hypothetical protein
MDKDLEILLLNLIDPPAPNSALKEAAKEFSMRGNSDNDKADEIDFLYEVLTKLQ